MEMFIALPSLRGEKSKQTISVSNSMNIFKQLIAYSMTNSILLLQIENWNGRVCRKSGGNVETYWSYKLEKKYAHA